MLTKITSLIALGVGYVVFINASKEKKNLKFIGQGIGVLLIAGALITMLSYSMDCVSRYGCPFAAMKSQCSMMGK